MPANHHNRQNPNPGFPAERSTVAMTLFTVGCVLEAGLIRLGGYLNGTMRQMVLWHGHLLLIGGIGTGVFTLGAVILIFLRVSRNRTNFTPRISGNQTSKRPEQSPKRPEQSPKHPSQSSKHPARSLKHPAQSSKRPARASGRSRSGISVSASVMYLCGLALSVFGAWTAAVGFICFRNISAVIVFSTLVPVVTILTVLWCLYHQEAALAFTLFCFAALCVWIRYRGVYSHPALSAAVLMVYAAVAMSVLYLFRSGYLARILSVPRDSLRIPFVCVAGTIGAVVALTGPGVAYYVMWGLILCTFGLVVYETVRQL